MSSFNFIKTDQETDKHLFFGPLDNEEFIEIQDKEIMAHLLFKAGVFQSVSEARKNNWNKPIPGGFTDFYAGKNKIRITILNIILTNP